MVGDIITVAKIAMTVVDIVDGDSEPNEKVQQLTGMLDQLQSVEQFLRENAELARQTGDISDEQFNQIKREALDHEFDRLVDDD